ncbi:MAG TPA: AAA family ATPase [Methylomirabilota bacterium]|nr:AAA family ATPase [Methylomirabilota bacterium]
MGSRPLARLACPEIVGRDEELAAIGQLAAAVETAGSVALLISGEAGLGKSALLGRATEIARRAGLRVLRAQGERLEMPRAFGPFVDLLRTVREPGPAVIEALRGGQNVTAAESIKSADERYRAHASFARAVAEVAEDRPLMLTIDDLHWADESSLELFAYLARRLRKRLMLVGAYRNEEVAKRAALRRALEDIPRDRMTDLALRPLTASDMSRALKLILGPTFRTTRETRELLQAQCRGNPLFLEEMLRALVRRGELIERDGTWQLGTLRNVPLPRSVQEAVHERFQELDGRQRQTIIVAAVIGERFEFDLLRRTSGLEEADVVDALRAATRTQIITDDERHATDAFVFRHALVREAILQEPLARERRLLHQRVAGALEQSDEQTVDYPAIAYHYEQAGDRERAFAFHRKAADQDARRGAFAEAHAHYVQARALAPDDDRTLADLSMLIARSAGGLGRRAQVYAAICDAVDRYERLGDVRSLAGALLHLGNVRRRHLLLPLSLNEESNRRVSSLLEPLGDSPSLAWHQSRLALSARANRDYDRALELTKRGVEIAHRCKAGWEEGVTSWTVAETYYAMGDVPEWLAWLRKTVAITSLSPENGRMQMEITTSRQLLGLLRHLAGETDETRALQARIRHLDGEYPGDRDLRRLEELLATPDWDEFVRMHDDWSLDEGNGTMVSAHMGLHRAFVDIARTGPAPMSTVEELREALLRRGEIDQHATDGRGMPLVVSDLALATSLIEYVVQGAMIAGDSAYALRALEMMAPFVARPLVPNDYLAIFGIYGVLAASEAGDEAAASRWIDLASWPEFDPPLAWSDVVMWTREYVGAERQWRRGEHDEAIEALTAFVAARNANNPDPLRTHLITLRYCELLVSRGTAADRTAAAKSLASVVDFYRKAGATWYLERLRERAERLGLPYPSETRSTSALGLTRREREVAGLIAQGLTNKEIAERLTLSVRTAESHVDQIRTKLGFRTRSQIASWATQQPGIAAGDR